MDTSHGHDSKNSVPSSDEQNRTFLVRCSILLTALALILYTLTRDPTLLLTTGIVGTSVIAVFRYYFHHHGN